MRRSSCTWWRPRPRSTTGRARCATRPGGGPGGGGPARGGGGVAILSLGPRLADALRAADELAARGLATTVADARFAKPLDTAMIEQLARHHEVLIIVEEGSGGGFSSLVLQHLAQSGLLDHGLKLRPMVFP